MGNVRRTVLEALALACLPASLRAAPTRADGRPDGSSAALSGVGMPYDAFDALPVRELKVPDGILRIAVASDLPAAQHAVIDRWALRSAQAIADFYGRFPVPLTRLLFISAAGGRINGTTWSYRGPAIRIPLGLSVTPAAMLDSWVLMHEMAHLALPSLADAQLWLEEGTATYVESVARVRIGQATPASLWAGFVQGMPHGLPQPGDEGLDHTQTWGRTYWGGALFCLLADIAIRETTGDRHGLPQALRGVLAAGGSIEQRWTVEHLLSIADAATGTSVLASLYAQMKDAPVQIDLPALWAKLGVLPRSAGVGLDDGAPLAAIRRAITG
ncbi:hypothetical protein NMQ14_04300 [Methyloversatilis sp. XJ19-13]|uniref:hypothetical protein n=1 Tax=Methyloversatilis sp. XJ19-13 TaxID=2963430 RepID=UPI00211C8892|nr:hypothetical protein [Methyloversatilis sp. XJ19-13]MCQ9373462.1 hypothetical protein [Methyloversatilis sp. XJ19-13]